MIRPPRSLALLASCALFLVPAWSAPEQAPPADKPKPDMSNPTKGQVIDAVMQADLEGLKKAVAENPSQVDLEGPVGMTPLGVAISRRNPELIQTLLKAGADPNKPFGVLQMHPIQGAAASGSLPTVTDLLARGVDPNKADLNGGTALHAATLYGKEDIAALLVEKGADVNAAFTAGPNKGATPLHFAARSKKMTLVMAVNVARADWTIKWNGRTPAELADSVGAKDVGDYIRQQQQKPKP